MKPAFSVIVFTVASGAGLGMFVILGLQDILAIAGILQTVDARWILLAGVLGFALVIAGLCASTLHLARPSNAWRAFTRFRTSWLSREAVFALLFIAVAALWLLLCVTGVGGAGRAVVALAMIALAWIVLVCTGMIYASLKPIRQWHTRWTPVVYVALGHWSGAVLVIAALAAVGIEARFVVWMALLLGVIAVVAKARYWHTIDGPTGTISLEQAIGVPQGVRPPQRAAASSIMRARLLDSGHSHGTYLTDEFGFVLARRHRSWLRFAFWVAGIGVPLAWVAVGAQGRGVAVVTALICLLGVAAERWLFFAEARHTVRLYHGAAST